MMLSQLQSAGQRLADDTRPGVIKLCAKPDLLSSYNVGLHMFNLTINPEGHIQGQGHLTITTLCKHVRICYGYISIFLHLTYIIYE